MMKNARRPMTYGKTTRRYLLSESQPQDDPQHRRLWREPSRSQQESPSASPDIGTGQDRSAIYDFDVPSSEGDVPAPRLDRPLKKRKLTPPTTKFTEPVNQVCGAGADLGGGRDAVADDFEVPSSDDEPPQPRKKIVQVLSKGTRTSSSQSYGQNQQRSRQQSPSLQLRLEASPRLNPRKPQSKSIAVGSRGTSGTKRPHAVPVDSKISSSNSSARGKNENRSTAPVFTASSRTVGYSPKKLPAQLQPPSRPLLMSKQERPRTPPGTYEFDDLLSKSQHGVPESAKLTPGGLNLTDLTVNDGPPQRTAKIPDKFETGPMPSKEPDTPRRRKLKDRLINLGPAEDRDMVPQDLSDRSRIDFGLQAQDTQGHPGAEVAPERDASGDTQLISRNGLGDVTTSRRKVTYGRQRSHLSESQMDEDAIWSVPLEGSSSRPSGRRILSPVLRDGPSSQEKIVELSEDEGTSNDQPLRSVHELRAAGEARRTGFLLDTIFDDIQAATSTGSARGAAFRLTNKLLEPAFSEEFVRHGSLTSLFSLRPFGEDSFVGSAYAVAILQVVPLIPMAEFQGQGHVPNVIRQFESLLERDAPLVKAGKVKKSNMSRAHQADLLEMCRLCCARNAWIGTNPQQLTPQLIGLQGLDTCVRRLRKAGAMHRLVGTETFAKISNILRDLTDSDTKLGYNAAERHLAISVLESLSLGDFLSHEKADTKLSQTAVEDIAISLPYILRSAEVAERGRKSLALRLCLNVTTKSAPSCDTFAQLEAIKAVTKMIDEGFKLVENPGPAGEQDAIIDNLILGLGFLTNLTEEVPECRPTFNQPPSSDQSDLSILLAIFQARHESAASAVTESETKVNVAFGYLAVLLCSLSLDRDTRGYVASVLGDASLMKLREAMAQFVVFHRTIDMDMEPHEDGHADPQAAFVERLQQVLSTLNTMCMA